MSTDDIDEGDEKEWRHLCQLVSNESNPQRLSQLLDQLITALDARRQALLSSQRRKPALDHDYDQDNK
jgi:hypothetical protein